MNHLGQFDPKKSAIRIEERADGPGFLIHLNDQADGDRLTCIACLECVGYCPEDAALESFILAHHQG